MRPILCCLFAALLTGPWAARLAPAAGAAASRPPAARPAPPDAATAAKAEQLVRQIFADDFARPGAADRKALARKLLDKAGDMKDDPAGLYVMLRDARDAAVAGRDPVTAVAAVRGLHEAFSVPLADRLADWSKVAAVARPAESAKAVVEQCRALGDDAVAADDYDVAVKAALLARASATSAADAALVAETERELRQARDLQQQYAAFQSAEKVLRATPGDKTASLAAASFLCFAKGDWARGLPMLAGGSDPVLGELARSDQAAPTAVDAQVAVGDGWWDVGEKQAKEGRPPRRARERAALWYRAAVGRAGGLVKAKVTARLASVSAEAAAAGAAPAGVRPATADDVIVVGSFESRHPPVLGQADGLTLFKIPDHDPWWQGGNGVLVRPGPSWERVGTVWQCDRFQPRPWGVKFIHPLGGGHVMVDFGEGGVELRCGGPWSDQGGGRWADKKTTVPVSVTPEFAKLFPPDPAVMHTVRSELSAAGAFKLYIDGRLVAAARVTKAEPLVFADNFVGDSLPGKLEKGQAGVIIDSSYVKTSIAGDVSLYPRR